MIIAIDGPSGTGKSTVAKAVARRLGFIFFDTGAMYRSMAWQIREKGILPDDEEAIREIVLQFRFDIRTNQIGERFYFVDEIDVTQKIRTQEISTLASKISVFPFLRHALVKIQRSFGHKSNAVFEGRDMGTVVFPDAELKIFLTARPEIRANRRYREMLLKFPDLANSVSKEQILREIEERDRCDMTRSISPLRQAKDAILIDTSDYSADQVVEHILKYYLKKNWQQKFPPMKTSYRFVYLFARAILKIFYRLRIYGLEHFRAGPAIIAGNHASFLDPPVISVSCPEEVNFLARESLFRRPFLGRLIRILNTYPVSRNSTDVQTFKTLIQLLQAGKKVILFPEGKRTIDGNLQPLEKGLAFLIYKSRCGILPVYVDGTFSVWNRKMRFPRFFGSIRCVFGTPIEWEDFEGLEKKNAMEQITQRTNIALHGLKEWLAQGAIGLPP